MKEQNSKLVLEAAPQAPADEEALEALMILMRRLMRGGRATEASVTAAAEPWMTPANAAAYAAVSEDTLRLWISTGQLPAGRVGKVIRVKRSDIDALLKGKKADAPGPADAVPPEGPVVNEPTSDTTRAILNSLGGGRKKRNG